MRKIVFYLIYVVICFIQGMICEKAEIKVNDWKYWMMFLCVLGAYFCGAMTN